MRVLGELYPPFVLLVVVATGNNFFFDAAAATVVLTRGAAPSRISELPVRPEPLPTYEELVA